MADRPPETDAGAARVAQAEAFIARHRGQFSEEALHAQLRQAGYTDQEIRLALGRIAAAGPPRPASPAVAFAVGALVAVANLALFPIAILLAYGLASSSETEWAVWLILGLILLAELALIALFNRGKSLSWAWALALLAPIAAHLIFFGLCITGGIG